MNPCCCFSVFVMVDMRFLWCGNQAVVGLDMREDNLDMREENLMGFGLLVWSLRDDLFWLVWSLRDYLF